MMLVVVQLPLLLLMMSSNDFGIRTQRQKRRVPVDVLYSVVVVFCGQKGSEEPKKVRYAALRVLATVPYCSRCAVRHGTTLHPTRRRKAITNCCTLPYVHLKQVKRVDSFQQPFLDAVAYHLPPAGRQMLRGAVQKLAQNHYSKN